MHAWQGIYIDVISVKFSIMYVLYVKKFHEVRVIPSLNLIEYESIE